VDTFKQVRIFEVRQGNFTNKPVRHFLKTHNSSIPTFSASGG
jgi:hypothetical protein